MIAFSKFYPYQTIHVPGGHTLIDIYSFRDPHLDAWKTSLSSRETNLVEGEHGLVVEWDYETTLGFLNTTERTYRILNQEKKKKLFEIRGLELIGITGRGRNIRSRVRVTSNFYYHIMLRRYTHQRIRQMPEHVLKYLDMMITGNGLLEHGGVTIVPMLMDISEKLSFQHSTSPKAIHKSLKQVRAILNEYGYLVSGREAVSRHEEELSDYRGYAPSLVKMHRAYRRVEGESVRVTGPQAYEYDQAIRAEHRQLYLELDRRFPLTDVDEETLKKHQDSRKQIQGVFREKIAERLGLSYIKTVYLSSASIKMYVDKNAILSLMMRGISFPELETFMEERQDFWNSYDLKIQARDEAEREDPSLRTKRFYDSVFASSDTHIPTTHDKQ